LFLGFINSPACEHHLSLQAMSPSP